MTRRTENCDHNRFLAPGAFRALALLVVAFVVSAIAANLQAQTPTTTLLSVSAGTLPVISVAQGTVVTLSIRVSAAGVLLHPGLVDICDTRLTCTGSGKVATVVIPVSGTAIYRFVPGPGLHSYKASFRGFGAYGPSASPSLPLTVLAATGPQNTTVGVQTGGMVGDYSLLGTVATSGAAAPSGYASFLDTSNANYSFGSAALAGTGAAGITFLTSFDYVQPRTIASVFGTYFAVFDTNNDGYLDTVVAFPNTGQVCTFLGKGDGTFQPPLCQSFAVVGELVAGDFDGDGITDLVMNGQRGLVVLFGLGDGTFRASSQVIAPTGFGGLGALAVDDLNGDGNLDIVFENDSGQIGIRQALQVALGKGDGTFSLPFPPITIASDAILWQVQVADLNEDGKQDLVFSNFYPNGGSLGVLLGNGDGSFQPLYTVQAGDVFTGFAIGDVNGDGHADIVATRSPAGSIGGVLPLNILLGKGDGTFSKLPDDPNTALGSEAVSLADFNGDGIPDLVLPDGGGGRTNVFIGKGDGTFVPDTFSPSAAGLAVYQIAIGDFNGDGQSDIFEGVADTDPDVTGVVPRQDQLRLALSQRPNTTAGYLDGVSPVGTGLHYVIASYPGDANNVAGVSSPVALLAQQVTTNLMLGASPSGGAATSAAVTLTAVLDQHFAQNHEASGTVTFTSNGKTVGKANVSNGAATLTTTALPAGTDTLRAVYAGDTNFLGSTAAALVYPVITNPMQTITFPQPPGQAYAATAVALQATSSAGLPITYTVVSGPATVAGSTLTYSGAGTVVLEADQAGDGTYPAAAPVQVTVPVTILTEPLTVASAPITTLVTILSSGTLAALDASTQGAVGLDFSLGAGGTCKVGTAYTAGQTCTVQFVFTPLHPGLRYGGVTLTAADGTLLANSYLLGLGTGPQVLYNPPNQTNVGTGFGGLSGVAVDGNGNVYGSDIVNGAIYQVSAATGATRLLTQAPGASDVAVDGSGNVIYTTRTAVGEILAVNGVIPANPQMRMLASGFLSIDGVKVDAVGNVFVAEGGLSVNGVQGGGSIQELLAVNGSVPANPVIRKLVTFGIPTGVAIDVVGNVYFSDELTESVYELVAVGGSIPASPVMQKLAVPFLLPANVSFDVSGNLYVPDYGYHDVQEVLAVDLVLPANPVVVPLGTGLGEPAGVFIDAGGSLFVADETLSTAVKLAYGSAPTLSFAATEVGQTSADSPRTVTITNGGNAPLSISPPASGTNPSISANFAIDAGTTTCPTLTPGSAAASLPVNASCTTGVSFTPATVGNLSGTLVRTDNNLGVTGATQTILLHGLGLGIPPAIVFTVANHTFGDAPFTVGATSNSPGAITYSVVGGPATIAGTTVTLTGAGVVVLQASQVASGLYAAGSAQASFNVAKKPQTIDFPQPASPVAFTAGPITLAATASSGLPVSFSILSGPGRVSGNVLTVTGGGTIVLAADQPGDANYAAAVEVTRTVVVSYGTATVTLTGAPNPVFVRNPVTLTAEVSAPTGVPGGQVTFMEGSTVLGSAAIAGGSASLATAALGVGLHTITAVYGGDVHYATATSAAIVISVQDFSLTITNPKLVIQHGGVAAYQVVVTSVGGVGLAGTISLAVAGEPDRSTYTFAPAEVAAGSGTTAVALTIQTPNYPTGPYPGHSEARLATHGGLALAAVFALLLLPRRRRVMHGLLVMLVGLMTLTAVAGCGSGWKTQEFDVVVTATSGALVRTAAATLTSQP